MTFSAQLIALGQYLAGEFDNHPQALAQPAWYVHLRLWIRPVPLFTEDSITLFAEQASVVNLNQPYRPRLLRLRENEASPQQLRVEYYMFKDIESVKDAGTNPQLLQQITLEQIEFLPNCTLNVEFQHNSANKYHFKTSPQSDCPCSFNYQGKNFQVFLGFEVTPETLLTYDKGIDPQTGKGIWGALLGAYQFTKIQDFADELLI
ncbi:protein of unknown function DUF1001 [Stanieria cyanosphaera PCC 7437]|uniref:Chromophore lyase CpcT/CpeT n=1 Tax=Stanieria cyanosphaera (strain ATCC 29371 / PCC 7437) TaxID=111780 RepID=K9XP79_STAC7|nr:chromophore lyase CpcT/CpeT [Stanieria cyanosphaera]AFZ33894.1 protein of unknown function DUF1001 [Stanieria cyanosphaera PCC 7437]